MRHPNIAPCNCRTSQGATRQLRTLRLSHVAPCDIALSHHAISAYRTLRLENPAFRPQKSPLYPDLHITAPLHSQPTLRAVFRAAAASHGIHRPIRNRPRPSFPSPPRPLRRDNFAKFAKIPLKTNTANGVPPQNFRNCLYLPGFAITSNEIYCREYIDASSGGHSGVNR